MEATITIKLTNVTGEADLAATPEHQDEHYDQPIAPYDPRMEVIVLNGAKPKKEA